MQIEVHDGSGEGTRVLDAQPGATLLHVLREAGISVAAPCGGRGVCGKCTALVTDAAGTSFRLACETLAEDGMGVNVSAAQSMAVSTTSQLDQAIADGTCSGLGIAYDIGTTTVVCRVVDRATGDILAAVGRANPQAMFGADVISRISACAEGSLETMHSLISDAAASMAHDALDLRGCSVQAVTAVSLAANTVMEHIAAGIDPQPIGVSPFTPPTLFGYDVDFARTLFGETPVRFARCVAGYVGGDVLCGMQAVGMDQATTPLLLLDLGTNGEMALGSARGITTCATAAGPVFEGANISCGMPAFPGAISRVELGESGNLELTLVGQDNAAEPAASLEPVGLCGTGLIDAVALLLREGLIDETGYLLDSGEAAEQGLAPALAARLCTINEQTAFRLSANVTLTQGDIRNVQLAKAAVNAGILTLLEESGTALDAVDELLIAGGFGEYLNLENAARVGIFPKELLSRARSVGNTSLEGATLLLCREDVADQAERIAQRCNYVELSTHPRFTYYYVESMAFEED